MSAHTQTPWEILEPGTMGITNWSSNIGNEASGIRAISCRSNGLSPEESRANAAFIVRAVNSHEFLVGALEALESAFMAHTHWNGVPPQEIIDARAALFLAKP